MSLKEFLCPKDARKAKIYKKYGLIKRLVYSFGISPKERLLKLLKIVFHMTI